ncbi:DUF5641 domain-containing protein, partial [Nephila pilipes]
TILCDWEQIINSRPITYVLEVNRDPAQLTPMMFLQELPSSGIFDIDSVDYKLLSRREKYRQRIRDNLRNRFRTKIIDIFNGRDNVVRLAKVKTDNGIFLRPIQRLFPLEISQSEDDPLPGGDVLHKQVFQKQSAYPAAGLERPSQDTASSNVPRTERVIKPPQRLDL